MPSTRRWREQRWLLDAVIGTAGVDWDQGRSFYLQAPCGVDAYADFEGVRKQVRRFDDITPAFAGAALRRERLAREADAAGHHVTARRNYFTAAVLHGAAQWPIFESSDVNRELDARKLACYRRYAALAGHPVERVEIPFGDTSLPGWLHLPHGDGPFPAVLSIDGMDGFKEMQVALDGDPLLSRGLAVLAIDGPGQGECTLRGVHVTADNWRQVGPSALAWLRSRPEIDGDGLAVQGISFGSYFATLAAAASPGWRGCAVAFACHEPGCTHLFESASPTFKLRFMYMAGFEDEDAFDRFAPGFDVIANGGDLACPYLVVAGEQDELSPIEHTHRLLAGLRVPCELLLYAGERHGLHASTSSRLGPNFADHAADWLLERLRGIPARSRQLYVDASGATTETAWEKAPQDPVGDGAE